MFADSSTSQRETVELLEKMLAREAKYARLDTCIISTLISSSLLLFSNTFTSPWSFFFCFCFCFYYSFMSSRYQVLRPPTTRRSQREEGVCTNICAQQGDDLRLDGNSGIWQHQPPQVCSFIIFPLPPRSSFLSLPILTLNFYIYLSYSSLGWRW